MVLYGSSSNLEVYMVTQWLQKKELFISLNKLLSTTLQELYGGVLGYDKALERISTEYLIITEHFDISAELYNIEYFVCFENCDKEKGYELSRLYDFFISNSYQNITNIIQNLGSTATCSDTNQLCAIMIRAISLIEKKGSDYRLEDCLEQLESLINDKLLDDEHKIIKDQLIQKTQRVEHYQKSISILALINECCKKANNKDITSESQQEILSYLDGVFSESPGMLSKQLEPIFRDIKQELSRESVADSNLSELILRANQSVFANGFGIDCPKIVDTTNLLLLGQEKLQVLLEYLEGVDGCKYRKIRKSANASIEYFRYQNISKALVEISGSFNIKELLYSLASFKINALQSANYYLWKAIVDKLEIEFFVNQDSFKDILYRQIETNGNKILFEKYFKFQLNIKVWQDYYQLAFERFLSDIDNSDKLSLLKSEWLSQQQLDKSIKQQPLKPLLQKYHENLGNDEQALYDSFFDILLKIDAFKKAKLKYFSNIEVDKYLVDFDVKSKEDFLNKKLAYKVLYSRQSESGYIKIYEDLYSKWMEIQSLYGEGFIICQLDEKVEIVDDLLIQLRKCFLTQEMSSLCDKLAFEISQLYIKSCERGIFIKLTEKINDDSAKLEALKSLGYKEKLSSDNIALIKDLEDLESLVQKSSVEKSFKTSTYIDELAKSCQKSNPLYGSGEKLNKLSDSLDNLNTAVDKKASITTITKLIHSL